MVKVIPIDTFKSFDLHLPNGDPTGILSIPHAGTEIPEDMAPFLINDEWALNQDVDWRVDELVDIDYLKSLGIAVIKANIHRVAIDINRPEERTVFCWKKNTHGLDLLNEEPDELQRKLFIEKYHKTYFDALADLISQSVHKSRKVVPVIDLHSMPSRPTEYHLQMNPQQKMERPGICLSDLEGKSCIPEYIELLEKEFTERGLDPAINDPYLGGYVTQFVDKFNANVVQIEINRDVYMDEKVREIRPEAFESLKANLMETLERQYKLFCP